MAHVVTCVCWGWFFAHRVFEEQDGGTRASSLSTRG